jgi:hypothetical protein
MTSKREAIMAAVSTLLASTTGVSTNIFRSRPEALSRAETPAIILEAEKDVPADENMDFLDWDLQFKVSVITRGAQPDVLADPIVNSFYALLMADRSLGGRVIDLKPLGVAFTIVEGDNPIGLTVCHFSARHRTTATDLTS